MGRSPCCDKVGLKKGPWTPEEDQKLLAYIEEHGHGSWRALPTKAGLQRCGKSCRLRWTNYLRPDIKRGKFNLQEEQTIIQLHALLGNRWSAIATHLPKRTDNEIKNYWNTHLKKRLAKMGIDPVTHKPKNDSLLTSSDGQSKNAAHLSHMAQWESARLEAEARLVRESKLRSHSNNNNNNNNYSFQNYPFAYASSSSAILKSNYNGGGGDGIPSARGDQLDQSPTSTLTFSENNAPPPPPPPPPPPENSKSNSNSNSNSNMIEFVGCSGSSEIIKEEEERFGHNHSCLSFTYQHHHDVSMEGTSWTSPESLRTATATNHNVMLTEEGFTNLLLNDSDDRCRSLSEDSDNGGGGGGSDDRYYEDNKNYWNSILNLVNSSPSDSPMF